MTTANHYRRMLPSTAVAAVIATTVAVCSAIGAAPSKAPQSPAETPLLPSTAATLPPPGPPQMAQGPRHLITPAPALTPRIPIMLVAPRKYAQASAGPGVSPAAAISTPPVNNLEGTATLPMLPPFTRDITVEISPPAAPLPFDREPYLQAPGAPDDEDLPATAPTTVVPTKPHLD